MMMKRIRERGEDLLIVSDDKGVDSWRYGDGLWSLVPDPEAWLELQIEITLRDAALRKFSFSKFVAEARKYIERSPDIRSEKPIVWNNHGRVPTRSGLIDPATLKIEPLKKEHFATWRVDIDYNKDAKCPLLEELLGDYFVDHIRRRLKKASRCCRTFSALR